MPPSTCPTDHCCTPITVQPLPIVSVFVVVLPSIIHFFWSWKVTHIKNVQLTWLYFSLKHPPPPPHVSHLELLIQTHSIPRKNAAKEKEVNTTMFLEHTVTVKFPIPLITVNIKTTAMFCPHVNSGWVGGGGVCVEVGGGAVMERFHCRVAHLWIMFYCC
jgi:hypothetical protein